MGLGNPGQRYGRGRHNVGFMVVDRLAQEHHVELKIKKYHSLVGRWEFNGEEILLVKPQTYMNRSGEAARSMLRYLPMSSEDLLVVYDDMDLPLGRIRLRARGSAGGHRGMQSVLDQLGRDDFFRLRVGIGRPPGGEDPTDFVLSPFLPKEEDVVERVVSRAAEAVESLIRDGARQTMETFNQSNSF